MESKTRPFSGKKPLLLTRPKDEHSHELESVVKMVQKLSNKIVDLEKDKEANSGSVDAWKILGIDSRDSPQ